MNIFKLSISHERNFLSAGSSYVWSALVPPEAGSGPKFTKYSCEIIRKRLDSAEQLFNVNREVENFIFIGCVKF